MKMRDLAMKGLVGLGLWFGAASEGLAQNPYDPPTAVRPPPNVMLLLDGSGTNLIDGGPCNSCHIAGWSVADANLWPNGKSRLQLARQALTGGWGWNSGNPAADARSSSAGVMDAFKVRWGVAWFDGLGTRIALDPTTDNEAAQKAVIDFGLAPAQLDSQYGYTLNSYKVHYPTSSHTQSGYGWYGARDGTYCTGGPCRMARALRDMELYWSNEVDLPQYIPPTVDARMSGTVGINPRDEVIIDGDPSNVMVSQAPAGCRRNFTILLSDGNGATSAYNTTIGGVAATIDAPGAAKRIYDLLGPYTAADTNRLQVTGLANQVFVVHFGVAGTTGILDGVADLGFDGTAAVTQQAFRGTNNGNLESLSHMLGAFNSIFSLVLSGTYSGAAPVLTEGGDYIIKTSFTIRECSNLDPTKCNLGRPGTVTFTGLVSEDTNGNGVLDSGEDTNGNGKIDLKALGSEAFDAGDILRSHAHGDRRLLTTRPNPAYVTSPGTIPTTIVSPTDTNCGDYATCAVTSRVAELTGLTTVVGLDNLSRFMQGDPSSTFPNGIQRGDIDGDGTIDGFNMGDADKVAPFTLYKMMDIANSRPAVVGAPVGLGDRLAAWEAFLDRPTQVYAGATSKAYSGTTVKVRDRDRVIYVGGNDGYLHAFLAGTKAATTKPGEVISYQLPSACSTLTTGATGGLNHGRCRGAEIWAFTPKLVHSYWDSFRSGHYFGVDGSPTVADVLFTKSKPEGGADETKVCLPTAIPNCAYWEYRTVLLQCLGPGGPGCFALDVTSPYEPQLLWERTLDTGGLSSRGTSTSRPQIARVKRKVGSNYIPYYVGLMGGGLGESGKASFVAVGLEDGRVWYSQDTGASPFAGAPTCVDARENDGYVDTCYVTALNGDVYKIGFDYLDDANQTGSMQMVKFYDMAQYCASISASCVNLKSYARIAATWNASNTGLNLFFATGNLEDIQKTGEQNYLVKLFDVDPPAMVAWNTTGNGASRIGAACSTEDGLMPLGSGEKAVFDPQIGGGTVLLTSFKPNANPCLVGDGALYGIRYDSCAPGLVDSAGNTVEKKDMPGSGLPMEPVVHRKTGDVITMNDSSEIQLTQADVPQSSTPVPAKLWFRSVGVR